MAKNKKAREAAMAAGQKSSDNAGTPASMQQNAKAGIDEYGTDAASSGRAMMEQQNNQLAQELLKKQQDEIKKKMKQGK